MSICKKNQSSKNVAKTLYTTLNTFTHSLALAFINQLLQT